MKHLLYIAICVASSVSSVYAEENPLNLKPLEVRNIKVQTPTADKNGTVTLFFNLADGYHAYIQQFKLQVESPDGFSLSEPLVDPIVDFYDPVTKKQKKGTEGTGTLVSTLTLPPNFNSRSRDEVPLKLVLTYQACTKEYCLFPTKLSLDSTLYMSGKKRLSAMEKLSDELSNNFWITLLFIFGAGILTSFTPCIFPMIPITLAVLGARDAGKTRLSGFILSLFYVLGIAFTYAILGLIAAKTGALFGSMLGHPLVALSLASIFIAMAFSMYGYYEIKLPDAWTNKLMGSSPSHSAKGELGAFLSGLVAGVVASPCVGPVLVSILAYVAKSQDGTLGFVLLFVYALGFGQIFLVMGTFSHLLKKMPRSGPWLDKTKLVFGTTMIAMALYVLWPVVKPYIYPDHVSNDAVADLGAAVGVCTVETVGKESCDNDPVASYAKPNWQPYSDAAVAGAVAAHKPVVIDFKADWCVACKELDYYTFSDKRILEEGRNHVWLYFNATSDSPKLSDLRKKYEILGLPFVTFYDSEGEWRKDLTLTGFENADLFLERLKATK